MGENKLTFETIEIVPGTCLLSECLLYYSYTKYITYVKSILSYGYNPLYDCICLYKIKKSYYT